MRRILKWMTLSFVICASLFEAKAQPSAQIKTIDVTGYPNIKATYIYKDAGGNEVRDPAYSWKPADILINESGKARQHNTGSPSCPPPNEKAFSAILLFDVSNTMQKGLDGTTNPPPGAARWELAVNAMKEFINAMNPDLTECALIQFSAQPKIIKWFTNNKDSLINSLVLGPSGITLGIGTNYNGAFIVDRYRDSTKSALWVAKYAKYKPVIIFLTDGGHETQWGAFVNPPTGDGSFFLGDVINLSHERNVRVFVIKIGNETLSGVNSGYLSGLAQIEGSPSDNLEMNVMDIDRMSGFYNKVLQICGAIGYPAPCEVDWKTECDPAGVRSLDLTFPNHGGMTTSATFTVPNNIKPYLEYSPNTIFFRNVDFTTNKDTMIKVTARNNFVEITNANDYVTSDPRFKIVDWGTPAPPFILLKDSSRLIKVRYDPTDSAFSASIINGIGSSCSGNLTLSGGMDLFVKNVDMGNATVGDSVTATVSALFCNRGKVKLTITDIKIQTGDGSMFSVINFSKPFTLDTGKCLQVTFRFKPTSSGGKASRIVITTTEAGQFSSNIIGNGIGQPGITANPLMFQNTDCKYPIRIDTVFLKNTGPLPLTINNTPPNSELRGDNGEFIIDIPGIPPSIAANSTEKVAIKFQPKSAGTKVCTLHIESNAGNAPSFDVRIEGIADSVNFTPDTTIDLGTVCLGDTIVKDIPLNNVGTKSLHISATTIPSSFRLAVTSWDLNGGSGDVINTRYIPYRDGPVDTVIVLTEDLCNIQKNVRFTGTVNDPKVTNVNIVLSSNVGVQKDTTITITNASNTVGLRVTSITSDDPQVTVLSTNPALPYTIPAPRGTMTVTIRYIPTSDVPLNSNLRLKGMPCRDVLIPLIGNPSMATVDIAIDQYTGLVGEKKDFDIWLRNANRFAESGTTAIDVDISFDASLLKQVTQDYPDTVTGGIRKLTLKNIGVKPDNNPQKVKTLKLEVTDGTVTSTPLMLAGAVSDKRNVIFNHVDGLFSLVEASAKIYTKDIEVEPGREFDLEIWQSDAKNLSSFHENITTEVRSLVTVLEGVGLPDTVINGDRIVTLSDIPINNSANPVLLKKFKFKAMLGLTDTSYIILQNSRSKNGKINFDSSVSRLKVKVCTDSNGTKRLFDPYRTPAALDAVNPNPTSGITEVHFTLIEPGPTNIWISNVLGDKIMDVVNEDMKPGYKTMYFDANNLPDGVYFVIMQTPTQLFKKRFNIIK